MARPRSPKGRAVRTHERLSGEYEAICELDHNNAFELLAATILSAQCTDARVNKTTPALFERFPDAQSLADANIEELRELIRPTGFFNSKSKSLIGMAQMLVAEFDAEVPSSLADLVKLPGVGRKTGNVIRTVVFDLPGLPVDTHVRRLANRIGMTTQDDPVKIELELNAMIPARDRGDFSLRVILHGRQVCFARKPACDKCVLNDFCLSAFGA